MIDPVADRRKVVALVRQVSLADWGHVATPVLLQRVCGALLLVLDFDRVAAARYYAGADEVSELAFAGAPRADRAERRPISSLPLLVQALEMQELVLRSAGNVGDVTSAFALPLVGVDRCLGFFSGRRRRVLPPDETDVEALAAVGAVAASLLENALAREELERPGVIAERVRHKPLSVPDVEAASARPHARSGSALAPPTLNRR
jgi:hypothetical protein